MISVKGVRGSGLGFRDDDERRCPTLRTIPIDASPLCLSDLMVACGPRTPDTENAMKGKAEGQRGSKAEGDDGTRTAANRQHCGVIARNLGVGM